MPDAHDLEGVMISLSVGIGRNVAEAEKALKQAKQRKNEGLRYNITTYSGEPVECPHQDVSATADSYLRIESKLSALGDSAGLEDLEVLKYDLCTGLLNRTGYEIEVLRLKQQGRYGERAIMMLDGDDMKKVNESLGYDVTDSYLEVIGRALNSQIRSHPGEGDDVREHDVLLNRKNGSGGDEFIIDIGCSKDDAWLAAMRYIDAVYHAQHDLSTYNAERELDRISGAVWVDVSDI